MACAWWHQAITWTNVDLSSVRFSDIYLTAVSQEMRQASFTEISLKISHKISFQSPRAQWVNVGP